MTMVEPVEVPWQGRRVEATAPARIARLDVRLDEGLIRRTEQASAAAQRAGMLATGPTEVAARLHLRSEGLASSAIEGLRATAASVALAEAEGGGAGPTARGVAARYWPLLLRLDDVPPGGADAVGQLVCDGAHRGG